MATSHKYFGKQSPTHQLYRIYSYSNLCKNISNYIKVENAYVQLLNNTFLE